MLINWFLDYNLISLFSNTNITLQNFELTNNKDIYAGGFYINFHNITKFIDKKGSLYLIFNSNLNFSDFSNRLNDGFCKIIFFILTTRVLLLLDFLYALLNMAYLKNITVEDNVFSKIFIMVFNLFFYKKTWFCFFTIKNFSLTMSLFYHTQTRVFFIIYFLLLIVCFFISKCFRFNDQQWKN